MVAINCMSSLESTEYDICRREPEEAHNLTSNNKLTPRPRTTQRPGNQGPNVERGRMANDIGDDDDDPKNEDSTNSLLSTAFIGGLCVISSLALSAFGAMAVRRHYRRRKERAREANRFHVPGRDSAHSTESGVSSIELADPVPHGKITFFAR